MKTLEYRYIDKAGWGEGPWNNEPDKVQWPDEKTGLPCLVVRTKLTGAWCGYVGVAEGHPFFGKHHDDLDAILNVHGGLTFSDHCVEDDKEHGICHLPEPGEPDHVWWLGFDCAHAFDLTPGLLASLNEFTARPRRFMRDDVYRDLGYVQEQCAELAGQIAAV